MPVRCAISKVSEQFSASFRFMPSDLALDCGHEASALAVGGQIKRFIRLCIVQSGLYIRAFGEVRHGSGCGAQSG